MQQLIVAVLVTVILVAFGFANSHHVELFYLFGEPLRIRLVFLVAISFAAGAVTVLLRQLAHRASTRHRIERKRPGHEARLRAEVDR